MYFQNQILNIYINEEKKGRAYLVILGLVYIIYLLWTVRVLNVLNNRFFMFCTHRISILLIKKTFHIIEYLSTEMNGRKRVTLFILLYIPKLLHTRN